LNERIMIVAGEASGDLHGSNLVREALARRPDLEFFGIGGARMREAGVEVLVGAEEMAVVGLVEVAAHFPVIYRAWSLLRRILRTAPPALLILIDYPDFNLRIARIARAVGVPVLYYISPQVWAWRVGRVNTIARFVDRMAVVFPFEVPFYEKAGLPATFVGHPLVDSARPRLSRDEAFREFVVDSGRRVVGLFPGSRHGEIRRLLPVILDAAALLRQRHPDLQFVLPLASSLTRDDLAPYLAGSGLDIRVIACDSPDLIQLCDAIITASGTVTLEIALQQVPMVIIYKVSPLTYQVGKRLIRVDHVGICNIVAGERVVPELIQDDADPARIAAEIGRVLEDRQHADRIRAMLGTVKERLGSGGASARVAEIALEMLKMEAT
jgi:lipid-A-disaccharide synthase